MNQSAVQPPTQQDMPEPQRWLLEMLKRNSHTVIGRQYDFSSIRGLRDYTDRVPVHRYADIEHLILRVAQGEPDVLFAGKAVAFERTSGTTGPERLIPYSLHSFADCRRCLLPYFQETVRALNLASDSAFWATSPVCCEPETTAGGIPIGLTDEAFLGADAMPLFSSLSAVPLWVASLTDVREWQLLTLYHLVRARGLRLLFLWSPTFFLRLLDSLEQNPEPLLKLLEQGGVMASAPLPPDQPAADRCRLYLNNRDSRILWPELTLVDVWSHGTSAKFARQLMQRLPQASLRPKGLMATEGIITIAPGTCSNNPVNPEQQGCPLARSFGLHEFLDGNGTIVQAEQLVPGQDYEVLLTTSSGLYRYALGDVVRCVGFQDTTPELRFLGRTGVVSDLVGEKLSDAFAIACLSTLSAYACLTPHPHADGNGTSPAYLLLLEADDIAEREVTNTVLQVEKALSENPHYAYARRIGQLAALEGRRIACLQKRLHDWAARKTPLCIIKLPVLCPDPGQLEPSILAELLQSGECTF